jgi:predicted KAP-like P-loop ATPase
MALIDVQEYLKLLPALQRSPQEALWLSYDAEADTLYINFKKPSYATDSELTDDDVIIRYDGEEIIGFTVLHASKRTQMERHTQAGDNISKQQFSADRPIASRRQDLLGRAGFAESLALAIQGWIGNDSLVIALYGSWGSGKTSIKNMVLELLRESTKACPLIIEFNPWQWHGPEQLTGAFFHEIGVALGNSDTSQEGKKRAAKWQAYGIYLSLSASLAKSLKTVLPVLGAPGSGIMGILAEGLEQSSKVAQEGSEALAAQAEASNRNLSAIKQDLSETLRALENPILIVMDDVDRLSTEEIRLLFQLIKVNADFPNLVYLLLFQRDVVEKSLEAIAPISGREFLEKIVQVGFDIPLIERARLEKVLFDGLNNLLADKRVARHFDQQRWGNIFIPGLRPYFKTLRDVRRLLATLAFQVSLFRGSGSFEVNPIDLIALEVLRVFEPEVYQKLPAAKAVLTDPGDSGSQSRSAEEEGRRVVQSIIDQAAERNRAQVREILKQLFPRIEWIFGGSHYGAGFEEQWFRDLRACHPKVFDRYFHLVIPEGDISQAALDRILSLVGDREGLVSEFRALRQQGLLGGALDRLEAYKEKIDLQHAVPFITALFDIGDELPDEPAGVYSIAADMHALRIIRWYLTQESDPSKRGQILKEAMRTTRGLFLPVSRTSLDDRQEKRQKDPSAFLVTEDDLRELKNICVEKIRVAARDGTLMSHPEMLFILYRWREWVSPEEPKQWVERLIESQDSLLAFLVAFLQRSRSWGLTDHVSRDHWYIRLKNVEDFIPADIVAGKIEQFSIGKLTDQQQRAVSAFRAALKRRQEGRFDDDWSASEGED